MERQNTIESVQYLKSETHFAPAGRETTEEIDAMYRLIDSDSQAKALLDAIPLVTMILNDKRQIVYVNRQGMQTFNISINEIRGKRPGELIGCVHSYDGPDGCGSSVTCKVCGAVNAIWNAQQSDNQQIEECRITTVHDDSFDWKVTATPIELCSYQLQCLVIEDISDQKRRQVLERTFFHDIINTIGAMVGFSRMLVDEPSHHEELNDVIRLADELMEEVQAQRELTLAESGDLIPRSEEIELHTFLNRLVELYQAHPTADSRHVTLAPFNDVTLTTDPCLLRRVLGNMIKNALEACGQSQAVTVSCENGPDEVMLSVHNPTVMAEEVKLQLFKRSFSTKAGTGRGIGTYSMKLFGEKYLGGRITFTSESSQGTTFSITLPRR